jgi:hypothetical protein
MYPDTIAVYGQTTLFNRVKRDKLRVETIVELEEEVM